MLGVCTVSKNIDGRGLVSYIIGQDPEYPVFITKVGTQIKQKVISYFSIIIERIIEESVGIICVGKISP